LQQSQNLRAAPLAGEPVDDDRHNVAGVVDEQLLSRPVRLPHRHRQPRLPAAIEFAEPRIPISVRMTRDVLVPHDRQRHVLALEVLVDRRPIRIGMAPVTGLLASPREQDLLQSGIGLVRGNTLRHPGRRHAAQRQTHRRGRNPNPDTDLARRNARLM
jgi:hypothetical protein